MLRIINRSLELLASAGSEFTDKITAAGKKHGAESQLWLKEPDFYTI